MCPTSQWEPDLNAYILYSRMGHMSGWHLYSQTKGNTVHSFIAFGIFNAMSEVAGLR